MPVDATCNLQGDPVDAEAAAELAALMAPGDADLAAAFASSPLAPRVAALCLLHSWVQQAQQVAEQAGAQQPSAGQQQQQQQQQTAAGEAGRQLWHQLFELALHDRELSATRYSTLGVTHRKKVREGECTVELGEAAGRRMQAMQPTHSAWLLPAGAAVAGAVRAEPTGACSRGGHRWAGRLAHRT